MNLRNALLNSTKITNALAGITPYNYDGPRPPSGIDHLVSATDPMSLITGYTVDGFDNPKPA